MAADTVLGGYIPRPMLRANPSTSPSLAPLLSKDTLLLFGYAPTGLGHIRVTDALWRGLSIPGEPIVIGASDKGLAAAHRLLSQKKVVQRFFEWTQSGWRQQWGTPFYRRSMRGNTEVVRKEVHEALAKLPEKPKQIVVLATHYDVAHRIAAAKAQLERETGVPIFLVVQVTDDSPQHVWLVPGADVIFVPSELTRETLVEYARASRIDPPPFVVLPYPIPGELSLPLSATERQARTQQLSPDGDAAVRMAVPISGAAAGLIFLTGVMNGLRELSPRFTFDIVCRIAPYTRPFLDSHGAAGATLHTGTRNHEVIAHYRRLYDEQVIALELTKPSEQAFKVMVGPQARGGAIVLFAPPVGRQEKDNLEFLTRHQLIPTSEQNRALHHLSHGNKPFAEADAALREAAKGWRSLELPRMPPHAAQFAHWALKSGLLAVMDSGAVPKERGTAHAAHELNPAGVAMFWDEVLQRSQAARKAG